MCGICGIINFNSNSVIEDNIRIMMSAMKYRGPDDDGVFIENNIGFGFVRLSILDLTIAGHQPMISNDNRFVIVFNGEIYNYIELRKELSSLYEFKTKTDTEIILASYQIWGEKCIHKFNGMWAFVIYDREEKTLFVSRDRFGIKPFYYFKDDDTFIFASDIIPLLKYKSALSESNDSIIFDYLVTNRTNHSNQTFYRNIKKLQHGHNIKINLNNNNINLKKWYFIENNEFDGYKSSVDFIEDLKDSIKLQLRSDVPIGVCLSGGLDSSTINVLINSIFLRNDIHSFSAVYGRGEIGDESDYISELSNQLSNIHYITPTPKTFIQDIDRYVYALGEPVPTLSEYSEFKVMELASKYCTVLFNGQGADEYLAGYDYFSGIYLKQLLYEKKILELNKELFFYFMRHKSLNNIKYLLFYLLPSNIQLDLLTKYKNNYISVDFMEAYRDNTDIINMLYRPKTLKESFLNHFEYKFEHNLLWADKSGMYFSLETRFPFLDYRIIEKAIKTETQHIYKNGISKVILRNSVDGIIPEKIRSRVDKIGYDTPTQKWFKDELIISLFHDVINSCKFRNRLFFNHNVVYKLFQNHIKGKKDESSLIYKILHLELWFNTFIDNKIS